MLATYTGSKGIIVSNSLFTKSIDFHYLYCVVCTYGHLQQPQIKFLYMQPMPCIDLAFTHAVCAYATVWCPRLHGGDICSGLRSTYFIDTEG